MLCPSIESNKDGSVKYAPCGTRKIEAALLNNGFKREDVIVAHPEHLDKVIGSNTKVLAISGFDRLELHLPLQHLHNSWEEMIITCQ